MTCLLISSKSKWVVLALCFLNLAYSQEAEKLFKEKYSKLSIAIQPSKLKGFDVSDGSSPTLKFNKTFSAQLGFVYNFAQYKNLNFKAGVTVKSFHPTFDIIGSNENLYTGFNYGEYLTQYDLSQQFVISETIKAEYFYPLTDKLNLVLGTGLSLDVRTGGGEERITVNVYNRNTNSYKSILSLDSNEQQVTGSIDISIGLNYKTKFGLFQLEIFNNSQALSYPKTGTYKFTNLENTQTKSGIYNVKGNYSGLTLIFSPRKGWLKRK